MGDDKKSKKTSIDDWMVRIAFAQAGEPDLGFNETGVDPERKSKLALDKIMVMREETEKPEVGGSEPDREALKGKLTGKVPKSRKLSIMIIDDEPIVGKRLGPALEKNGFEVEAYLDPARALARLKERDFDIVVTDFRMEELDGIQVLTHVMDSCPDTRVILITGYATVEVAREALVKGAFDFIAKPFKPKELRAVINKAALSLGHQGIA
jgi:CheY-like chemotaxis protein